MREIRAIGEDLKKFAEISANAYPGMKRTAEELYERYKELLDVDKTSSFYGIYEDELLGGMRLLDLKLNYLGKIIPAAGLGLVSVDLIIKKQGILGIWLNISQIIIGQRGLILLFCIHLGLISTRRWGLVTAPRCIDIPLNL